MVTSCPGYELSWVRVVPGTSCLGYELSWLRVVLATSCPDPIYAPFFLDETTNCSLSVDNIMCFLFAVAQNPIWSIATLLDGEIITVRMTKTQELFVVRKHSCSVFSKHFNVTKCE